MVTRLTELTWGSQLFIRLFRKHIKAFTCSTEYPAFPCHPSGHVNGSCRVFPANRDERMAAAGCSRYSATKGRQFRLALPQDDSNDSDDRRQYSGPVLFHHPNERHSGKERAIDRQQCRKRCESKACEFIRIHPNTSELRVCCSRPPSCFHSPLPPRQKFLHVNQTKSCFAF